MFHIVNSVRPSGEMFNLNIFPLRSSETLLIIGEILTTKILPQYIRQLGYNPHRETRSLETTVMSDTLSRLCTNIPSPL